MMSHTVEIVATKLINKLIDVHPVTMQDIEEVYHHRLHASKEELLEACNGYVTARHIFILQTVRRDIEATGVIIANANSLSPYDNILALLKDVPGLDTKSIEDLVAEVELDMSVFPDGNHLYSWIGIVENNNESTCKESGRITHGNKSVKVAIVKAMWVVTRMENTFYNARYHLLVAGRATRDSLWPQDIRSRSLFTTY